MLLDCQPTILYRDEAGGLKVEAIALNTSNILNAFAAECNCRFMLRRNSADNFFPEERMNAVQFFRFLFLFLEVVCLGVARSLETSSSASIVASLVSRKHW